jgi:hypothetical protein
MDLDVNQIVNNQGKYAYALFALCLFSYV